MKKSRLTTLTALGFLLPNFLGFAVFLLGPVLFSLLAAFTNWTLVKEVPFRIVGIQNFTGLLQSQEFWVYFLNTVYFMLGIPVSIAGSLFLTVGRSYGSRLLFRGQGSGNREQRSPKT